MRDDLILEGIIKPGADTSESGAPRFSREHEPLSPLDEEMQRLGIDSSLR